MALFEFMFSVSGLLQSLAITVVVAFLVRWAFFTKKYRLPPGPRPLPILGNMLELKGIPLFKKTAEWSQKFGPVSTVYLGTSPTIIISSFDAMNEAFTTKADDFSNRSNYMPSWDYATGHLKDITMADYNPIFNQRRKVAIQTLRQYVTGNKHAERVKTIVDMAVENILAEIKDKRMTTSGTSKEPTVELNRYLSFVMVNTLHTICFGSVLQMGSAQYKKVLNFFETLSGTLSGFWEDRFPILTYCPTKAFREYMKNIDNFLGYLREQIATERETFHHQEDRHTMVQNILMAEKQADESEKEAWKEAINKSTLPHVLGNLFFAGVDTSRETLSWLFLLLADKQDIQKKIREEIDATVGSALPCRDHRQGLVYTEAVIQETLRMFPVVPMGVPHETARDTKLLNYDIPVKTMVMPNLYAISCDPKYWKNPDEFIPERFIEDDGKTLARPQGFATFGAGPRSCLGEFVARQTLLFVVVNMLQKLEFHLEPGVEADYEPDTKSPVFNFSAKPHRLVVRVRK